MFGFFKKKEEVPDWRKKVAPPVYLTDFLKQQLFNFIAAYTQLTSTKKLLPSDTENVKTFIHAFDNKINDLKDTSKEPKGWFTLPGEFFKSLNSSEKKRVIEILQPVQQLAMTHLKMVTPDYDKLMKDTSRHKKLAKEYDEIKKEGGHISQNREFIAYWIQTISPQWFGIAHFVDDIKLAKQNKTMTILLYIIIGIAVLAAMGYFLGGGKQAKKYGPARVFLHPIIRKLQNEYPKYEMITENDGRVKYKFYSTSYSFTTDFIYNPNHIQVSVAWDSIINKAHKVKNCPYDTDAIERALNNAFEYFLIPPR